MKLNNWSVTFRFNAYQPPELRRICLAGIVDDHPKLGKNLRITTSTIKNIKGRRIFTKSGSEYVLGTINPGYRKYLRKERPNWDWRKPITILD